MITQLRFKNWRSLKDVTIDELGKITVFIGANSSGKTNILDGLKFRRDSLLKGLVQTVQEMGYRKIQTARITEDVELEITYNIKDSEKPITETIILKFDQRDTPFYFTSRIYEGGLLLRETRPIELPVPDRVTTYTFSETEEQSERRKRAQKFSELTTSFTLRRWQILGDYFNPSFSLSRNEGGDTYVVETDGRNVLRILELLSQSYESLYQQLQEDLGYILDHVSNLRILRQIENQEIRLMIDETTGKTAPTISTGTARLTGILTAIYALDMPQQATNFNENEVLTSADPGLIVIEEPDMGLNPGVLRRFVEQLRNYVDGPNPRQIIMTTHNPAFLDYFQPEEVRVVERDEQGYTTVNKIPDYIKDIWLKDGEYGLGEVWTTRSFGGVPE